MLFSASGMGVTDDDIARSFRKTELGRHNTQWPKPKATLIPPPRLVIAEPSSPQELGEARL